MVMDSDVTEEEKKWDQCDDVHWWRTEATCESRTDHISRDTGHVTQLSLVPKGWNRTGGGELTPTYNK